MSDSGGGFSHCQQHRALRREELNNGTHSEPATLAQGMYPKLESSKPSSHPHHFPLLRAQYYPSTLPTFPSSEKMLHTAPYLYMYI